MTKSAAAMVKNLRRYMLFKFNRDRFKATASDGNNVLVAVKNPNEKIIGSCTEYKGVSGVFENLVPRFEGAELYA